jgi:hypothetical protein
MTVKTLTRQTTAEVWQCPTDRIAAFSRWAVFGFFECTTNAPQSATLPAGISPAMRQYLEIEARRRGIAMAEMYALEVAAEKEIAGMGITESFLGRVQAVATPVQKRV